MLIKRLSKIGITLLLAVSFFMPFSFDARAEFSSTDSNNLKTIKENTDNIYSRIGTTNTRLSEIKTELVSLNTEVSNIKTAVANTITTTLNQINTKIGNIYSAVDNLEGYLDTVEPKLENIYTRLGTINGNIVTMGNYVQSIEANETANGTVLTDTYNLLNTYSNGYLSEIYKGVLILKDNISVFRYEDSATTVTVSNNSTLGAVQYSLYRMTPKTLTVADGRITVTNGTPKYVNFNGMWAMRIQEVYYMIGTAGNLISAQCDRLLYDTGYIGTELHLTYQLLDAFKSANHTDIIAFKNANHTDILSFIDYFKQFGLRFAMFFDNMTTYRLSDTQDSITVSFFGLEGTYTLKAFTDYTASYSNQNFTLGSNTRYGNTLGILASYPKSIIYHFRSYLSYLQDQGPANTIRNSVQTLDQNLTNLNNAETAASTDAISRINSFVPNISDISSLVALSWCSTFLQNLYLALGTFNIPILCGLVLAVCMQFIGYFRYKT